MHNSDLPPASNDSDLFPIGRDYSPLTIALFNQYPDSASIFFDAVSQGATETVKKLLDARIDPNLKKSDGTTPLFLAAQINHRKTVKLLLNAKADPNRAQNDGATPIDVAANNKIEKLLLKKI